MNIATNIASTQNSIGYLPELCTAQAVLRIMVGAQVLEFVLALTSASTSYVIALYSLHLLGASAFFRVPFSGTGQRSNTQYIHIHICK